jgi:hypothetical protein
MTLSFDLKIIENNNEISQKIIRALLPQINAYINKLYNNIKNIIPDIVINSIKNQPEYGALISGKLKAEFGLPDAGSRIEQILSTIKSGGNFVKLPTSINNGKIKGGIRLQMIQSDFKDLLSIGGASFVTEKGSQLDWLRWLLIEGDSVIISNYQFVSGPSQFSRTGLGIMKEFGGAFWRVPPEFAGNIKNNWITRAIDASSSEINNRLENLMSTL